MSQRSRQSFLRLFFAVCALSVSLAACAPATAAPGQGSPGRQSPGGQPTPVAARPTDTGAVRAGSDVVKGSFAGEAKALNGAGATFPAALYSKWFNEYEKVTSVQVNYQSIGSGGGIKSIQDGTVDFGATDGPMSDEQLAAAGGGEVLHVPAALGAVVPTYNVPELADATLKFSSDSLAGIFLGEITRWNDPRIAADNPGVSFPNREIVVVHRSDGSGTTFIWVDYLAAVSPKWAQTVGRGTSVNWPTGLGGRGNEGVAGEVKQNPYSIGYVELIYAIQNKLGVGHVKNKAGRYVEPGLASVTAAAAATAGSVAPDLRVSIVDAPGDASYPIAGFTWLLAYKNQTDRAKAVAVTRMLWWATHDAQKYTSDLGYAPLPDDIVRRAEAMINSVTVLGQKAFPGR